jgi:hypothetical protein
MVGNSLEQYTKYCPHLKEVQEYVKERPNQPTLLSNPFFAQQQQVVSQNLASPPGGNLGNLPKGT